MYDESVSILPFLSNVNKMSTTKAMETSDTIIVHDPKLLRDILGPDRGDVVRQRVRHVSFSLSRLIKACLCGTQSLCARVTLCSL